MEENIDIRRNAIQEIKEKIKKNSGYLHPCNKERLEDTKRLKFANGYEFTCWMQQNGIMFKPEEVDNKWAQQRGFRNHTEYQGNLVKKKGYKDYNDYRRNYHWTKGTYSPMSDNENCPAHLGADIAERRDARKILPIILGKIIKEMPYGNPGFDFLIDGDIKVDVKSRMLINNIYTFMIRHNNIANYFLCIGYGEDKDGNIIPLHIWLFKKDDLIRKQAGGNNYIIDKFHRRETFGISNISTILNEFAKYDKIDIFKRIDGGTS